MIELKSKSEINIMNDANTIVHEILLASREFVEVGMTTSHIDKFMENKLSKYNNTISAFKNYNNYPAVSCISVNEEVVHGIPGNRVIRDGDVVSIDFGVYYKGFAGDSALTFIVGNPKNNKHEDLIKNTRKSLYCGIEQMQIKNRLHDIGKAIDKVSVLYKYGNMRNYCGHGIGRAMHESPSVFNYLETREPNIRLREGMVFALEPMFSLGSSDGKVLEDKWTVITSDGSIAAHWELSIAITPSGPKVLGIGF